MSNSSECAICGAEIRYGETGANHLVASQCIAEGRCRDEAEMRALAVALFGAPLGLAYRDVTNAKRLPGAEQKVLQSVTLLRAEGFPHTRFFTGEPMIVRIAYEGAAVARPYFAVYLLNEFAERVGTVHSSHQGMLTLPPDGTIDCRIGDLALGEGTYHLMVDYGYFGGRRESTISLDCVPNAGKFSVKLNGWLGGVGLDSFDGAAMRSHWHYDLGGERG